MDKKFRGRVSSGWWPHSDTQVSFRFFFSVKGLTTLKKKKFWLKIEDEPMPFFFFSFFMCVLLRKKCENLSIYMWNVSKVFLSPCHLALIYWCVSFIGKDIFILLCLWPFGPLEHTWRINLFIIYIICSHIHKLESGGDCFLFLPRVFPV